MKNLDVLAEHHPEYLVKSMLCLSNEKELEDEITKTPSLELLKRDFWEELYLRKEREMLSEEPSELLTEYLDNFKQRLLHVNKILVKQTEIVAKGKYRKAYVEGKSSRMINRILQAKGLRTVSLDEDKSEIFQSEYDYVGKQLYHRERERRWNEKISDIALSQSVLIIGEAHSDDEFSLERKLRERSISLNVLGDFNKDWELFNQLFQKYNEILLKQIKRSIFNRREELLVQ